MNEEMLKRLDEQFDENYGWEMSDQDDVLDPLWDPDRLTESLSEEDIKSIKPCDIIYCMASTENDWKFYKTRPMLVVFTGNVSSIPVFYGFQLTTVDPDPEKPKTKFRYAVKDWAEVGLHRPSYINYEHFVRNINNDVSLAENGHFGITKRDVKGLAHAIEMNYMDLLACSYTTPDKQKLLDDCISMLEAI